MIYLDSSALLKLVFEEAESAALERWLRDRDESARVSSELARAEVLRATRRIDPGASATAREVVEQLDLVPLSGRVVEQASDIGPPELRTLDAIHLVSALSISDEISALVAYDHRLQDAARTAGLPVAHPGS